MKHLVMLVALSSIPSYAQDHHEVNVFDERILVEVSSQSHTGVDETQFWDMLKQEGWQQTQEAIQGIEVSSNLLEEISYRESLETLDQYIDSKQYNAASTLILSHPEWQSCDRIQWLWLELRSEASTGYGSKAKEKYHYLMANCEGHELSTTQKLMSWTSTSAHPEILSQYESNPNYNALEGQKIKSDMQLATLSHQSVSNNDLQMASQVVLDKQDAKSAELVGWKYLNNGDPSSALSWFENSIKWGGPSSKRIEGKLLSLQSLGEYDALEFEQNVWGKEYPDIAALDLGTEAEAPLDCETSPVLCLQSLNAKSDLTAQDVALKGWKLLEIKRPMSASVAFEQALALMTPADTDWDLTQYGYVLSLEKNGFNDKADALAMQINDPEKRAEIDKKIAMKRVFSAYESKSYDETLTRIEDYEQTYGRDVALLEIKAWTLYNSQRKREAIETYSVLADAFPHDEDMQHSYLVMKCGLTKKAQACKQLY
ncbi:hypothetical protein K6Q96_16945 [Grimontia kaedaensis]|uniref:Tetratricopeptide repeat protein n=1 Tax=Grimontia kaedaensis TaxID=2872157 RepID=A0ABY4X150_9GAMM|nr:hypothetical protein [Grimontia kaedaensis]USH04931.1 hypothetical protein K6Q96_16945 [Grimontia kaedaensis]